MKAGLRISLPTVQAILVLELERAEHKQYRGYPRNLFSSNCSHFQKPDVVFSQNHQISSKPYNLDNRKFADGKHIAQAVAVEEAERRGGEGEMTKGTVVRLPHTMLDPYLQQLGSPWKACLKVHCLGKVHPNFPSSLDTSYQT